VAALHEALRTRTSERDAALEQRNAELSESLKRQTSTSEILRAIADAPNDLAGVFDVVARNAARVCGAYDAIIRRVEGDHTRLAAHHGPIATATTPDTSFPFNRGSVVGRAILERQTIHVLDLGAVSPDDYPTEVIRHRQTGQRTTLVT